MAVSIIKPEAVSNSIKLFDLGLPVDTVANGTYKILLKSSAAFRINSVIVETASGTCDVEINVNGTDVEFTGSTTVLNVSSVQSTTNTIADNTVSVGNYVYVTVTNNSSAQDLYVQLQCEALGV